MEPRSKPRSKPNLPSDPRSSPDRHELGTRSGARSQIKPKLTQMRTRCGPDRGRLWSRSRALDPKEGTRRGEQKENKNEAERETRTRTDLWHLRAVFAALPNLEQRRHWSQVVKYVLSCRLNVTFQGSAMCKKGNKKRVRKVLELKSAKKHGICRVSWHP